MPARPNRRVTNSLIVAIAYSLAGVSTGRPVQSLEWGVGPWRRLGSTHHVARFSYLSVSTSSSRRSGR